MMTSHLNRKARRAAEHAARKQALKTAKLNVEQAFPPAELNLPTSVSPAQLAPGGADDRLSSSAISPAQLAANRSNAQLSTGPRSEIGKARSSKNNLKTALTGRTVLLPDDDADRYEQHLNTYRKIYEPVGERECEIVQSLADATWRLDRIPGLEEAIYVKGCNQFADQVAELDPRARLTMLRMHTYLAYERQFRNLQIQEMRLHRLREKLVAELKQLQKERAQKERDELATAAKLYLAAKHDKKPFDPSEFGFEFSTGDVEAFLKGQRARMLTEKVMTA